MMFLLLRISSDPEHLIPSHVISAARRKKPMIQNRFMAKTNNLHLHLVVGLKTVMFEDIFLIFWGM